jgi:hypothetical protein
MLITDLTALEGAKFHTKTVSMPLDIQLDHLYLALIELHTAMQTWQSGSDPFVFRYEVRGSMPVLPLCQVSSGLK